MSEAPICHACNKSTMGYKNRPVLVELTWDVRTQSFRKPADVPEFYQAGVYPFHVTCGADAIREGLNRIRKLPPVLDEEAGTYCSPACGGGCTITAYEAAKKLANEMVVELGNGWVPNVFENLGWHGYAVNGSAQISKSRHTNKYSCIINGGFAQSAEGSTPTEAFEKALKQCSDAHAAQNQVLRKLQKGEK